MKIIIVDTNVFLRFFLNDIPKQKKEFEHVLGKAKQKELVLSIAQIIVFELDFALEKYYQFSKEVVIDRLQTLVATEYINVENREIFIAALKLYQINAISFVDCFLVAKAKKEEAELFTFDQRLKKLIS